MVINYTKTHSYMAVSMYDLEVSVSHLDLKILWWDVTCTLTGLLWPAIFCFFATIATDRIASLGDITYNLNWNDYPAELRKHMILIIIRSQEPVHFTGLNLIYCTLEVFGKLLKTSCSYYIVFREFVSR